MSSKKLENKGRKDLIFCSRCSVAHYCSEKCKAKDFKEHEKTCIDMVLRPKKMAEKLFRSIDKQYARQCWTDETYIYRWYANLFLDKDLHDLIKLTKTSRDVVVGK